MARSLKKLGISGHDLCTVPKYKALLSAYARLLDLSIADVETKHALSRHWRDRPFATLTARHINQEAKVCVQEAQSQAESLKPKPVASLTGTASKTTDGALVCMKEKQIRSKAAYMFFRDDMLEARRTLQSDVPVNPCNEAFWQDLRQRWEALLPEQRTYYEEKSAQSKIQCEQKRLEKRKRKAGPETDVNVKAIKDDDGGCCPNAAGAQVPAESRLVPGAVLQPLVLPGDVNSSLSYNPWVLASEASTAEDVTSLAGNVRACLQKLQHGGKDSVDLVDECLKHSPVSQSHLESWQRGCLSKGVTWAQSLDQYNRESQRFSLPPSESAFPDPVTYQGHCGVFCRNQSAASEVLFYRHLLQAFDKKVSLSGQGCVAAASRADIWLRFQLLGPESQVLSERYAWLTAPSAQSGPHAPTQIFVMLQSRAEDAGVRLWLRSGPWSPR